MAHGDDPTADLMRFMDESGLDGSMLTRKEPFIKGVLSVRMQLVAKLREYIAARERDSYAEGRQHQVRNIEVIEESHGEG